MASKRSALDQNASAKKKPKRLCSFSSSWISEEFEVEHDAQTKSYSGSLLSGKNGDERAFCKHCKVSVLQRFTRDNILKKKGVPLWQSE